MRSEIYWVGLTNAHADYPLLSLCLLSVNSQAHTLACLSLDRSSSATFHNANISPPYDERRLVTTGLCRRIHSSCKYFIRLSWNAGSPLLSLSNVLPSARLTSLSPPRSARTMKLLPTILLALPALASALSIQSPFDVPSTPAIQRAATKPVPGSSPVELCDLDTPQVLSIDYIKINPNPPKKGESLYIEGSGILAADIEEGAFVEVEVRYGFIRLVKETIDLCEQLEQVDKSCPLKKGPIDFSKDVELPDEIPPGKYNAIARAYTADYKEITCLTAIVEFARS
ncbi:putative ML domain protein [Dipodascopsis tothii]|uniref:putative ML domain protein n=1 Tax=Dipodascopsis tothii TaxID=44089 RepID=UPI0034CD3F24